MSPLLLLPHLSKPQATVLALRSLGMVVPRSCALTAVTGLLATWQERQANSVRQQWREFCHAAEAKRGTKRQALEVESCFAPLLGEVVSEWEGKQLTLALDATALGTRFVVLTVSVVYRVCAIPTAWMVLADSTKYAWRGEWVRQRDAGWPWGGTSVA